MIAHKTPVSFDCENFSEWFGLASAKVTRWIIADIDQVFKSINSKIDDTQKNDLGESITERIIRDIKAEGYAEIEGMVDSGKEFSYLVRVI